MDPGPLLGVMVALIFILAGNALEGGRLGSLLGGPAAMIVLGGTMGAVLVQFPLGSVTGALRAARGLFKKSTAAPKEMIDEIVGYANIARRDGILALEKIAPNASDPFLSRALLMAVDGTDSNGIRETMERVIEQEEEHAEDAAKVFESAGGYSPTIGIVGAVLGLIHVMSNLTDINAVGSGIAAAFVATIYGVGAANIVFLPIGGRIKLRAKDQCKLKEMMLTGVLAIQDGTNPKIVRDRLLGYVHEAGDTKEGPARATTPAAA